MTAAAVILNSLRPFTQILREMINDESFCLNTRRSIWARIYIYVHTYIYEYTEKAWRCFGRRGGVYPSWQFRAQRLGYCFIHQYPLTRVYT